MPTTDKLKDQTNATDLRKPSNSSSVSQILRAISDGVGNDPFSLSNYELIVATDRNERQRAYRLAHQVYQSRGYVSDERGLALTPFDAHPDTLTMLAQDDTDRDAGTVSLVFDSEAGLPCDEIYGSELNELRSRGRRLIEVTRLAISDEYRHSKSLLIRLFYFIYIFGRRVKRFDDMVIEVNPRHVNYYRRLLLFEPAGPERPCPRVQGAPALLLRLNMEISDEDARLGQLEGRSLFSKFYSMFEESTVADYLANSHAPMTEEDAHHFGLEEAFSRFGSCAVVDK